MASNCAVTVFSLLTILYSDFGGCYAQKVRENYKRNYIVKQFKVPLDHFNYGNNSTFSIRYLYNDSFVESENSPLFFYTGNEGDIEMFAQNTGFLWQLAEQLKAHVIFAEHRYYGESLPFGNNTFNKAENLVYLTVEQALEDYAKLVVFLRQGKRHVIAFGGSYGGMLAAWFRMKYPHLITGALASSAPIWQFNGLTSCDIFAKITTSVFTSHSANCGLNIRKSWDMFKNYTLTDMGRKEFNDLFRFCDPITKENLVTFFDFLEDVYANLAMANYPYPTDFLASLPEYPIHHFCTYLEKPYDGVDLLNAMYNALSLYTNYTGDSKCFDYKSAYNSTLGGTAWDIQTCNEMVMPMCSHQNDTIFQTKDWNFKSFSDSCYKNYKLVPKLDDITIRYGGKNLQYVSNIIFSNGLLDPWSGGGVLYSNNNRITVIIIPESAHHLDLRQSNPADPLSVQEARKQETSIIRQWLKHSS